MSKQDLQEFVRISLANPTLAEQLEANITTPALLERAIAMGKENGYSFTEQELVEWLSSSDDSQTITLEDVRERAPFY